MKILLIPPFGKGGRGGFSYKLTLLNDALPFVPARRHKGESIIEQILFVHFRQFRPEFLVEFLQICPHDFGRLVIHVRYKLVLRYFSKRRIL
jgi:hypothetical protein